MAPQVDYNVDMFHKLAEAYAVETGCNLATAQQAAFVAAAAFADVVGRKDIGDYFLSRAAEMELAESGEPWKSAEERPAFFDNDATQVTQLVPANTTNLEQAAYRNGYWI